MSIQITVHVVLIVLVDLVEQVLVLYAQKLVLQQGLVGLLVLDLLNSLLCLLVVTHKLVILALFFLFLMIDFEKLDFCFEL